MWHGDAVWCQEASELTVTSIFFGRGAPVGVDLGVFNFQDLMYKNLWNINGKEIKHKGIINLLSSIFFVSPQPTIIPSLSFVHNSTLI